jgi:DNA polymerase
MRHIAACRPWLDAELAVVRPKVVLCLGATAAKALLGSAFEVTRHRGQVFRVDGLKPLVATSVHPASILRARGDQERRAGVDAFVRDLEAVRRALER